MFKKLLFVAGALALFSHAQETITENIETEIEIPVVEETVVETPVTEVTEVTVVEEITPVTEIIEETTVVEVEEITVIEEIVSPWPIEGEYTGSIGVNGTVEGTVDIDGLEIKGANLVTVPAAMFAVVAGLALLN